jgi:hypothetical protein
VYRTTIEFHNRITRGEKPDLYVIIHTPMGHRLYSDREFPDDMTVEGAGLLDKGSRVKSFGSFERTISPSKWDLLTAFERKQRQSNILELENSDRHFSKIIAKDPLVNATISIYVGFFDQATTHHLVIYQGTVSNVKVTRKTIILESEENYTVAGDLNLSDYFYLKRAGRYSDPLNSNDRLPVVYGDLTDGENGNWILPCLNYGANVYAFAGHAVLPQYEILTIDVQPATAWVPGRLITGQTSGATCVVVSQLTALTYQVRSRTGTYQNNEIIGVTGTPAELADQTVMCPTLTGSSITIYEDGMELNPIFYEFKESDNYEGEGIISTINFTTPKGNAVITARGKGKASGLTLTENIVDVIYDFLTVENNFPAAIFDATTKATATVKFNSQSYKAAGIIHEDISIWEVLQNMMSSFLGSVFINGNRTLSLDIDDGIISEFGTAAPTTRSEIIFEGAEQRMVNIVNQIPASFGYDYVRGNEFRHHTNDDTYAADIASQAIYGIQKPASPYRFYWNRNEASIKAIQQIIIGKFAYPVWIISFEDITLKRCHVDAGDLITVTSDNLYDSNAEIMTNHIFRVLTVNPQFARGRVKFKCLDTGYYTYLLKKLDGTFLLDGTTRAGANRDTTDY